ncbi:patatin-like protein [Uniformispora flossi]|uniref:patatin-like protein n=1 Tax=Uniformispora flossi TaxID=3390723 RepID=UPI003C2E7597
MGTPIPPTGTPGTGSNPAEPEIRLAATFTGGVSLAIWMGGVAREMNLLCSASRMRRGKPGEVEAPAAGVRDKYRGLLDLLGVGFGIDVLSGTSAGAINAAVLGLAEVWQTDIGLLRGIWLTQGSFGQLLRRPSDREQPSLLYGDEVLLADLSDGLHRIIGTSASGPDPDSPVRVMITTTLLDGEDSRYTDDYGVLVRDTTHRGLFTFASADLAGPDTFRALALAARSSASFPGAFEPAFLPIGAPGSDPTHPVMSPYIGLTRAQHVADGGLLANRPLGPALEAIFDRAADREVRRVLAYVVPSAGLPEVTNPATRTAAAQAPTTQPPTPQPTTAAAVSAPPSPDLTAPVLGRAVMWDLNAALSQTISAELADIAAHNAAARARRRADGRLARLAAGGDAVTPPVYAGFRDTYAHTLAATAAEEALRQRTAAGQLAADGRPTGFGSDADVLTDAAEQAVTARLPGSLPEPGRFDALATFGRPALDGGKAILLGLLTSGFALRPAADERALLDGLVARTHAAMPAREPAGQLPTEVAAALAATEATNTADIADTAAHPGALGDLASSPAWRHAVCSQLPSGAQQSAIAQAWAEFGGILLAAQPLLSELAARATPGSAGTPATPGTAPAPATPPGDEPTRLADLLHYLTVDGALPAPRCVARLFELHVLQHVLSPGRGRAPQAVELVQISADTRCALDVRSLAAQKLTGLQLHHFGAFYKSSWCANDWMWGRLDGAGWLVQLLLDPRHLAHKADASEDPARFRTELVAALREIADADPPPGVQEPFPDGRAPELGFLTDPASSGLPRSLPVTSIWVAGGLQRLIAAQELATIAEQADRDVAAGAAGHAGAFLAAYRQAAPGNGAAYPPVPSALVADVLHACRVSDETLQGELGTSLMSETLARTAAVATRTLASGFTLPWPMRPAAGLAKSAASAAYRVEHWGNVVLHPRRHPRRH